MLLNLLATVTMRVRDRVRMKVHGIGVLKREFF